MKCCAAIALSAALAGCPAFVCGQAYPAKPIRFIVPYAPGGGTDIVSRLLGQELGDAFGQQVIIDNRPGAGGTLGTDHAAKSPPDGYTMVLNGSSVALAPTLYTHLPYDTLRDLAPVSLVASQPNILAVHPSLPVQTVKQLLALAKAKPGVINYASGGNGSANQLATELLKLMTDTDFTHVPYKGTGPSLTDLLSGQVQMTISVMAAMLPFVNSGRLRALAVTGSKRSAAAPDIPTLAEAGVPGYEYDTWYGIQLPAKAPRPIVDQLNAEIGRILQKPQVRNRYAANGLDPVASSPEEFSALLRSEIPKWAKVIKAAGIAVQ